tara:strand:- start:358 stop:579 length:222 start_codon:yes stop_codon:yes gene_type:complete
MSTFKWLNELELEIIRKNTVKKVLRKEIDDKIEQLRALEIDLRETVEKALNTGQSSPEDVEWDLMDKRLNGGK